jgi:hypothetical protein
MIVPKSRRHKPQAQRTASNRSECKPQAIQRAEIKPGEQVAVPGRSGWTGSAIILAFAALLVTVAGLAVKVSQLNAQLERSDLEMTAAKAAATQARIERVAALQERDEALENVKKLDQQTGKLRSQIASSQETIDEQQNTIIDLENLRRSQDAKLLDLARDGTEIEPGAQVTEGKKVTVKGELVTPGQKPARFVTVDAWRDDTRIATAISDKAGRFSLAFPSGDEVVLKFTSPGRMTSDITLTGKRDDRLNVLLVDRDPDRLQR